MVFKVTPTKYIIKNDTITFWCNLFHSELKSIFKGTYVVTGYTTDTHHHSDMDIFKYKDDILNEGKVTIRTRHALINKQLAFCPRTQNYKS